MKSVSKTGHLVLVSYERDVTVSPKISPYNTDVIAVCANEIGITDKLVLFFSRKERGGEPAKSAEWRMQFQEGCIRCK